MLTMYPACFFKEESGYSVIFPDLNWLSTCGDTLSSSIEAATDCLAGYLYISLKTEEDIPLPSELSTISLDNIANELEISSEGAFINIISVDVEAYAKENFEKSVKKTLSIPAWLNKVATEQNINFSQVLQEALLSKVKSK